jgi:HEAT repeat protein
VVTSGASRFDARARSAGFNAAARPTPLEVRRDIVPALLDGLSESHPDVADSAALALGRSIRAEDADPKLLAALKDALGHKEKSAREAATLALGVLGAADSVDTLKGILKDSKEARQLTNHPEGVEPLVRAFAAASLGLLHAQAAVPDLKDAVNDSKTPNLGVKGMAVLALGMMRENQEDIVSFLLGLMQDRSLNNLVRAQAPIALGRLHRLNDAGSPAVRQVLVSKIVPLFNDDKTDNDLRRSLAICIGMVATTEDTDAAAVEALIGAVANAKDDQTRHYSIMALAEIGARDTEPAKHPDTHAKLKEFFLRELTSPKRITHQPFGALGLAIYARNPRLPPELRQGVSQKLQKAFNETTNPSYEGAMAIGLGLLDAKAAADDLWKKYADSNDQSLKGHIAVALGLMRDNARAPALREEIQKKDLEPKYRLQLARALGLMSDVEALPVLVNYLRNAETLAEISTAAQAVGLIGDKSVVPALIALAKDESQPPMSRAFAEVALGILAEKTPLPWYIVFSVDANYRAKVDALSEILDLL